jgi:hypothetical protein
VKVFAEAVADAVCARDPSLIDQRDPRGLGGRRHIEAVRRRMAERTGDAFQKGRDYLLTPAAVRDELERLSRPGLVSRTSEPRPKARKPSKSSAKAAESAELAKLKRELESEMSAARRGVEGGR